ncbi:calreticulin 3 [Sparganum proliferum]
MAEHAAAVRRNDASSQVAAHSTRSGTNESIAKPADWDDRELFVDTSDKQPTYWEDEFIPDQDLDLPSTDWLNSEVWNIPTVPNPHRGTIWKPRILRNAYYNGPWLGQRMKNPEFSTSLHDLGVIGAVAIDIWQPYSGVVFDNILLTDDENYAERFAASTWAVYQRLMRSYKYKQDLVQYSMKMKSSVLARTKLDPRDELSDDDMDYLRSKYHRPRLNDLEGERQAVKLLRQKRYTSPDGHSQWQMAKREALEAFLDMDFLWHKLSPKCSFPHPVMLLYGEERCMTCAP